jgi:hypothetical protein
MMIRKIALTIMNFVLFGSPVTSQAIQKELTRTQAYVQDTKPTQSSKSLEGEWKGTLEVGGQKLRLTGLRRDNLNPWGFRAAFG